MPGSLNKQLLAGGIMRKIMSCRQTCDRNFAFISYLYESRIFSYGARSSRSLKTMKKKKKNTVGKVLARAGAGAAIGFAAYMLLKSDKPVVTAQDESKEEVQQEELFI